jgi:hypothetical protein
LEKKCTSLEKIVSDLEEIINDFPEFTNDFLEIINDLSEIGCDLEKKCTSLVEIPTRFFIKTTILPLKGINFDLMLIDLEGFILILSLLPM